MKTTLNLLIVLFVVTGMSLVACNGGGADHSDDASEETTEQTEGMDDAEEGHSHDGGETHDHDHDAEDMDGDSTSMNNADESGPEYTSAYICPMHCAGSGSAEPGDCPVCGMKYRENKSEEM